MAVCMRLIIVFHIALFLPPALQQPAEIFDCLVKRKSDMITAKSIIRRDGVARATRSGLVIVRKVG